LFTPTCDTSFDVVKETSCGRHWWNSFNSQTYAYLRIGYAILNAHSVIFFQNSLPIQTRTIGC
jgi:hypothetical protein